MSDPRRAFTDRRTFLLSSSLLATSPILARAGRRVPWEEAAPLKVGLVGCGGRGTGAAKDALMADPGAELFAMADAFEDHLESSFAKLQSDPAVGDRVKVDEERRFVGFGAFRHVVDACDVVLFATSPHFRPEHVEYAVEKNRHMFVEKPVATDAPGLRRIWKACDRAREKGLSLVSGLCYRYERKKIETMKRVLDGAIGEIRALQCTYNTGGLWHRGDKPEWSRMEYQMRNWLYYTWLSGDHIAEQHIHSLDKILWAMGDEPPVRCTSSGGRISRTDPRYGHVYDHFNTVYEWRNGVRGFSSCRQWVGAAGNVSDFAFGTKGTAALQHHRIEGENPWRARRDDFENDSMYLNEHIALFGSIRAGEPINNGDYMCKSTLMAIMGRMSAYTGQVITWEQALNSEEDLSPPAYDWIDLPEPPVAVPGVTRFS